MQYRTFGSLDWQVSALGFGAMRLPIVADDPAVIDEQEATRMVRYAIDQGVNYIDTAYPYHQGTSEGFLSRALLDGYRERVRLATKMPCFLVKEHADLDRYFEEQLERLQTGYVDFYLFHALDAKKWTAMRDLRALDWAERQMADGRIGHLGFSFHDSFDVFREIVDYYDDWTLAQIQFNLMDIDYQAGTRGLKYAADRGLAVVVMEPIRGGMLSRRPPEPIRKLWDTASKRRTPADWALQWVWDHPEVSVVLSGMSTMTHVQENVASAAESGPGTLTADEKRLVAQVRERYRELATIPCTNCQYCLPCPSGVDIPRILRIFNEAMMYNDIQTSRRLYSWQVKDENRADVCQQCGTCEQLCPQSIEIMESLAQAYRLLTDRE